MGIKISFPMFGENFILNPPTHFKIFGYPIYLYAVIIAFGFLLATLYVLRRRRDFGLTQDNVLDLFIIAVLCGIVGARLYYIIFNPGNYFGPGKWLNIFNTREGGLALYGGVIGAVVGALIYARRKKIPATVLFDVGGLGLLIGQSIGRWGNFVNREAYGAETSVPWRMGLQYADGTIYVHPTFLYESLWNAVGFVLIHIFSKKNRKYDGQIFLLYVAWYGFGRFFIEGLRTDSLYLGSTDIRISQLVAAVSFAAAVYFLIRNRLSNRFTPDKLYVNRAGLTDIPSPNPENTDAPSVDAIPDSDSPEEEAEDDTHTGSDGGISHD